MNIYLVSADVKIILHYPDDEEILGHELRLVKAASEEDAEDMFEDYWAAKNRDYSHWYHTSNIKVHKMIEKIE